MTPDPQAPPPPPPAPPSPPPRAGTLRRLEIATFAVVFVAGTALGVLAFVSDSGPGAAAAAPDRGTPVAPSPIETEAPPSPEPTEAEPTALPPDAAPILIQGAESEGHPNGCQADLFFVWHVDRGVVPQGADAIIELDGPAKAGSYVAKLQGTDIEFRITVPLGSADDRWTADIESLAGQDVFPTPLEVSFDLPGC